jgi:hypothetical protein
MDWLLVRFCFMTSLPFFDFLRRGGGREIAARRLILPFRSDRSLIRSGPNRGLGLRVFYG